MKPEQARKILDRNSTLASRRKSRIFGNIDTNEKEIVNCSELIQLVMDEIEWGKNIKKAFESDNWLYRSLKNESIKKTEEKTD